MKTIILAAIGLAVLATPLAAQSPRAGTSDLHRTLERNSPYAHPQARVQGHYYVAPTGSYGFGLTVGTRPTDRYYDGPGLDRRYGGHGLPYSTPPQGWPDRR